jgi:hypothetical protein
MESLAHQKHSILNYEEEVKLHPFLCDGGTHRLPYKLLVDYMDSRALTFSSVKPGDEFLYNGDGILKAAMHINLEHTEKDKDSFIRAFESNQIHELGHWLHASPKDRLTPNFGFVADPDVKIYVTDEELETLRSTDWTNEDVAEGYASVLGILIERAFRPDLAGRTLDEHGWLETRWLSDDGCVTRCTLGFNTLIEELALKGHICEYEELWIPRDIAQYLRGR